MFKIFTLGEGILYWTPPFIKYSDLQAFLFIIWLQNKNTVEQLSDGQAHINNNSNPNQPREFHEYSVWCTSEREIFGYTEKRKH